MTELLLRMIVLALAWFACVTAVASVFAVALASISSRRAATRRAWVFLAIRLLPTC